MSNRNSNIENIGNQYTSDKNKKKRIQKKKMKIVRRRITLFGGILLAIIIIPVSYTHLTLPTTPYV